MEDILKRKPTNLLWSANFYSMDRFENDWYQELGGKRKKHPEIFF